MGSIYFKSSSTCHGQWVCFFYTSQFLIRSRQSRALQLFENPVDLQLSTALLRGPKQLTLEQARQSKDKTEVRRSREPGR